MKCLKVNVYACILNEQVVTDIFCESHYPIADMSSFVLFHFVRLSLVTCAGIRNRANTAFICNFSIFNPSNASYIKCKRHVF